MNLDRAIGDIFVEEGYIARENSTRSSGTARTRREPLGELLVRLGYITEKQKLKCVGLQMGVPFVDLARVEVYSDAARVIRHSVAIRLLAVPWKSPKSRPASRW